MNSAIEVESCFFFYQKKSVTNEHVEIKPELIGKDCQNIDSFYLFDGAARLVSWEQGTPRSLVARRPTSRPSFLKTSVYCLEWEAERAASGAEQAKGERGKRTAVFGPAHNKQRWVVSLPAGEVESVLTARGGSRNTRPVDSGRNFRRQPSQAIQFLQNSALGKKESLQVSGYWLRSARNRTAGGSRRLTIPLQKMIGH